MRYLIISFLFLAFPTTQTQAFDICPSPPPTNPPSTMRSYMFGHSLMDHRPPLIATPSDETTIAHWLHLLTEAAGNTYEAAGQYGFLPQHANLPPNAQWGYDIVAPAWDSDFETFAEADFDNVLITAANFAQWQAPHIPYYGYDGVTSPLSATLDIADWVTDQESGIRVYIYENWPDMASYLANGFPPTAAEFTNYNNYTLGSFHDWWLEYHDSLMEARPLDTIRMIPVGPILTGLLTNTVLSGIPITELYEDDAPHGRATIYFLAGLVTYMAINEAQAPAGYTVPSIIHSLVQDNYATVVDYIWDELLNFNDTDGNNRVFFNSALLPIDLVDFSGAFLENRVQLNWETASELNFDRFEIEYSPNGTDFQKIGSVQGNGNPSQGRAYDFEHFDFQEGRNYYRLKQIDIDGKEAFSEVIQIEAEILNQVFQLYPNPNNTRVLNLSLDANHSEDLFFEVHDLSGRQLFLTKRKTTLGVGDYQFDLNALENGMYIIKIQIGGATYVERLILN